MKQIKTILIMSLLFSLYSNLHAADKLNIVGMYDTVPGQSLKYNKDSVEIIEFLSFYCGHCFQFERSIPAIRGNFPGKIRWKTIPIYWGKGSPRPGEAYLLAEEAGKGDKMKKALFESFFLERRDIASLDVLEDIGSKIGLGFDFSRRLRAGEKSEEARKALELANKYGIQETPTLIIAGNLKTSPGMVNNSTDLLRDNVILILKSLFLNPASHK